MKLVKINILLKGTAYIEAGEIIKFDLPEGFLFDPKYDTAIAKFYNAKLIKNGKTKNLVYRKKGS